MLGCGAIKMPLLWIFILHDFKEKLLWDWCALTACVRLLESRKSTFRCRSAHFDYSTQMPLSVQLNLVTAMSLTVVRPIYKMMHCSYSLANIIRFPFASFRTQFRYRVHVRTEHNYCVLVCVCVCRAYTKQSISRLQKRMVLVTAHTLCVCVCLHRIPNFFYALRTETM